MKKILNNLYIKNILSALAIMFGGFVLLNITFMFYGLLGNLPMLFLPQDYAATHVWFPPLIMGIISFIVLAISWFVLRSKWPELVKAMFIPVPTAVVLVTIGLSLYQWPVASFGLSGLVVISTLYFFYRKKLPWTYWFAVIIVALALVMMMLTGQDI